MRTESSPSLLRGVDGVSPKLRIICPITADSPRIGGRDGLAKVCLEPRDDCSMLAFRPRSVEFLSSVTLLLELIRGGLGSPSVAISSWAMTEPSGSPAFD